MSGVPKRKPNKPVTVREVAEYYDSRRGKPQKGNGQSPPLTPEDFGRFDSACMTLGLCPEGDSLVHSDLFRPAAVFVANTINGGDVEKTLDTEFTVFLGELEKLEPYAFRQVSALEQFARLRPDQVTFAFVREVAQQSDQSRRRVDVVLAQNPAAGLDADTLKVEAALRGEAVLRQAFPMCMPEIDVLMLRIYRLGHSDLTPASIAALSAEMHESTGLALREINALSLQALTADSPENEALRFMDKRDLRKHATRDIGVGWVADRLFALETHRAQVGLPTPKCARPSHYEVDLILANRIEAVPGYDRLRAICRKETGSLPTCMWLNKKIGDLADRLRRPDDEVELMPLVDFVELIGTGNGPAEASGSDNPLAELRGDEAGPANGVMESSQLPPYTWQRCAKADLLRFHRRNGDPTNTALLNQLQDNNELEIRPAEKPLGHANFDARWTDKTRHAEFVAFLQEERN